MSKKSKISALPSALAQAGIVQTEYFSDSIQLREVLNASLIRIHSLSGQGERKFGEHILPATTGECAGGNPAVLCLRPNEWLLYSDNAESHELLKNVQGSIDPQYAAAYDNSDGLAVFRLSGAGAPWLLGKLSGPDYFAGIAQGQHCTRTKMGHMAVVVHYHPAGEDDYVFDLIFDRSLAPYLWELLIASSPHTDELTQIHAQPIGAAA